MSAREGSPPAGARRRAPRAARALAASAAAALLALALAGCPLPQPLPDYPEGQPVTPPRIVVNDGTRQIARPETVVRVPAGCAVAPVYDLAAPLRDANTIETIVARWFVNYDPTSQAAARPLDEKSIFPPGGDALDPTLRETPTFTFRPYDHATAAGTGGGVASAPGAVHVLELVVSNGFDRAADTIDEPMPPLPFRTPLTRFEIQLYRWVFVTVAESATVPCPAAP